MASSFSSIFAVSVAFALIGACHSNAVSATGLVVTSVTLREECAPSDQGTSPPMEIASGPRLAKIVAMADKHRVMDLDGSRSPSPTILDGCEATLEVRLSSGEARHATVRACRDDRVCAFFEEAHATTLFPRRPRACRSNSCPPW